MMSLRKKAGWGARDCWSGGWENIAQRPYKKKDDISDLMSEKNKDNFQIYETYVAIKAEHEY